MPKEVVDYSNTIIYKIYCKDISIDDVYVGHTTNFSQRKYQHKISCNNLNNKLKIYNTIREHGGWENWDMVEIGKYNCKDHTEARIKEQEHYDLLNCSLNSCPPFIDKNNYFCNLCNVMCETPKQYKVHINTNLHNKKAHFFKINPQKLAPIPQLAPTPQLEQSTTFSTDITLKNLVKYCCNTCDYNTSKKQDYNRHLLTTKHKINTSKNSVKEKEYICKYCKKKFKERTGLWKHKKNCIFEDKNVENVTNDKLTEKELLLILIKQNAQLIEQNVFLIKNSINNNAN
jgi:hypothetical protein